MNNNLFNINNFNVIEDDNYYYFFRALNKGDAQDFVDTFMETGKDTTRIRTDRERYEEEHGRAKYSKDDEISLEEVFDHIKMHHIKETNCISMTSNANVALDYGNNYDDQYAVIKVPKNIPKEIISAGDYMLFEIFIKVEETIRSNNIDVTTKENIKRIDNATSIEEINDIVSRELTKLDKPQSLLLRLQQRQYFNPSQQLEYNKLIAKVTLLEALGLLPNILEGNSNSSVLSTVGNAFSSGELIHYKDIPREKFKIVSKEMMTLFGIIQQLKDKYPNNQSVKELEKKVLDLYNKGYDIKNRNGKIVLENENDTIDLGISSIDNIIYNKKEIPDDYLSLDKIYDITNGTIDYNKAVKTIKFCYSITTSRKEAIEYSKIVSAITGNNELEDKIKKETISVNSEFIDRGNNHGYRLCESVNIGMKNEGDNFYDLNKQKELVKLILDLDENEIDSIIDSNGDILRERIIQNINKTEPISRNEYYARSIIDIIDFNELYYKSSGKNDEKKNKLINELKKYEIINLYKALEKLKLNHKEISYIIINLFLEKKFKGYNFEEICKLDNIDEFVKENFSVFNNKINIITLDNFYGVQKNKNEVPESHISLRDFQKRIKEDVDKIYDSGKRFAGVVLPTGGGKSFIAMAEMLERKDKKIVYIAPRLEILRQFKKHIVEYVAGCDAEGLSDSELDVIVKSCFPHLDLICYQGLGGKEERYLANLKADFIILDEIHHIGGQTWNPAIKKLVDNNKDSKVLGITATPQRDSYVEHHGEEYFNMYGGDMMMAMAAYLDDYTYTELMQRKYLACDINIIDAIQEGYVVCPNIVSFDYTLADSSYFYNTVKLIERTKDPVARARARKELSKAFNIIETSKLEGVDKIFGDNIKVKDGRYILFLPRKSGDFEGTTEEYIKDCIREFKEEVKDIDPDPHIEYIYSGRGKAENQEAMKSFELDTSDHMKVLVAIDMLNEGVHLPNISGSFNYRRIDSNHLILALQHLGRVVFALDPDKELTDAEIPIVFDKFNNYSNLDMDRLVNKKTTTSDLEKLKNIIFWIEKYERIPQIDSDDIDEQRKAITLKHIKEKYGSINPEDLDKYNYSDYDKYNIQEIIRLCNEYNIWDIEQPEISREKVREIERVNLFKVSATKQSFLDTCNNIRTIVGEGNISVEDKLNNLLKVLDILAENNIILSPETIKEDTKLQDLLQNVDKDIIEDIMYEVKRIGIKDDYPLGLEFYFGREKFFSAKSIFSKKEYTFEDITNYRKYGILCNGEDYKFVDDQGFIIEGPQALRRRNIWTGTYFTKDGFSINGYDEFGFAKDGTHKVTGTKVNEYGFDKDHINEETQTLYDIHGFDINHINNKTNTIYNPYGFDCGGYYHHKDKETGEYEIRGYSKYDPNGYDIDGYDRRGFNRNGIHKITKKPYDENFFDVNGFYYEVNNDKKDERERKKTERRYNDKYYDRDGYLYEKNKHGIYVKSKNHTDKHGFMADGLHYKTKTELDPRGFDINGIYHKKNPDGSYTNTGSIFDERGWTIDKLTVRTNVYGSIFDEKGNLNLSPTNEYGFDYDHKYHRPKQPTDKYGFKHPISGDIVYTGTIMESHNINGIYYDIHWFNEKGINYKTGTHLNPDNFDRDGYYWKKDEEGNMYNTYSFINDLGWTIDKKFIITLPDGTKDYSVSDENGFTANHYYKPKDNSPNYERYDKHGFDYNGINVTTGTKIDESGFDRDGFYWKKDEEGKLINTQQRYNEDGWDQDHKYIKTNAIVDEHGFNYLHLFVKKQKNSWFREPTYSEYDNHGFDYEGNHKKTGTHLNRYHFDRDGYYWEKVDGKYQKTDRKRDKGGFDIDGYDIHNFGRNGKHRYTRTTLNEHGFNKDGIHYLTKRNYDENGYNIDGEKIEDVDINLLRELKEKIKYDNRISIDEIVYRFDEVGLLDELIASFDEGTEEFENQDDIIYQFIQSVLRHGIKDNNELYTEDEAYEYLVETVKKRLRQREYREKYEYYEDYHVNRNTYNSETGSDWYTDDENYYDDDYHI